MGARAKSYLFVIMIGLGNMPIHAQTDFRLQHIETAIMYRSSSHSLYIPNPSKVKQEVTCKGCVYVKASSDQENTYELYTENTDSITLMIKRGKDISKRAFRLRNLPSVQVYLDGFASQQPRNAKTVKGQIRVSYPPEIQGLRNDRCRILAWQLLSDDKKISGNGNDLSDEALQLIRNSKIGRQFELIVKYNCPGGCLRSGVMSFKLN